MTKKIVIVGSNSIHCKRYIAGVTANSPFKVAIITNQLMPEFPGLDQYAFNFALHNLRTTQQIRNQLTLNQPDIVHIHQANSYAWHTLRAINKLKKRPKVILTTWGSDVLLLPNKNKFLAKMVHYNLINADLITSDSLFMSARIASLLNGTSKPIHTINFGIQSLPEPQPLQSKQKIILSNRLHRSLYQVDKIISAFAQLVNHRLIADDYQLVVAADGDLHQSLHKLANDLGVKERVKFTGMLAYSDLISYYQRATIFVSVPISDGTASSLLESMAYGCIPVLSNLPANLEWVLDKVNGFITPDVDQLYQQILEAIKLSGDQQRYRELYGFNYRLISQKATFDNNIKAFIDLYQ